MCTKESTTNKVRAGKMAALRLVLVKMLPLAITLAKRGKYSYIFRRKKIPISFEGANALTY